MLSVFDGLRDVTTLSVFVRLACALICGGIIGIERSYKRRPAGFRTHILICIGAAITTRVLASSVRAPSSLPSGSASRV